MVKIILISKNICLESMAAKNALGLNNGQAIKFLEAEKFKPYEIYRRMCDIYGEECFSKKYTYTL